MRKYLVLNTKSHVDSARDCAKIVNRVNMLSQSFKHAAVLCPPMPLLALSATCIARRKSLALGAQNLFWESGAHTGETSPELLKSLRVGYAIIGHSERRAMGETNTDANAKIRACVDRGMTAVVCVGERTRDPDGAYLRELAVQIAETVAGIPEADFNNIIIAYEPVWAIGKDAARSATPEEAVEMALYIKKVLHEQCGIRDHGSVRVLYGGSVNGDNARGFAEREHIAGLLVGRASADVKELLALFAAFSDI